MSKRLKFMRVDWVDAHADNDFHGPRSLRRHHKPRKVATIGILWRRTKKGVTIIRDYDADGECDGRIFIPTGMITKMRKLRGPAK